MFFAFRRFSSGINMLKSCFFFFCRWLFSSRFLVLLVVGYSWFRFGVGVVSSKVLFWSCIFVWLLIRSFRVNGIIWENRWRVREVRGRGILCCLGIFYFIFFEFLGWRSMSYWDTVVFFFGFIGWLGRRRRCFEFEGF